MDKVLEFSNYYTSILRNIFENLFSSSTTAFSCSGLFLAALICSRRFLDWMFNSFTLLSNWIWWSFLDSWAGSCEVNSWSGSIWITVSLLAFFSFKMPTNSSLGLFGCGARWKVLKLNLTIGRFSKLLKSRILNFEENICTETISLWMMDLTFVLWNMNTETWITDASGVHFTNPPSTLLTISF